MRTSAARVPDDAEFYFCAKSAARSSWIERPEVRMSSRRAETSLFAAIQSFSSPDKRPSKAVNTVGSTASADASSRSLSVDRRLCSMSLRNGAEMPTRLASSRNVICRCSRRKRTAAPSVLTSSGIAICSCILTSLALLACAVKVQSNHRDLHGLGNHPHSGIKACVETHNGAEQLRSLSYDVSCIKNKLGDGMTGVGPLNHRAPSG